MDKKALTPELKQIYERVMNTPTKTPTAQTAQSRPQTMTPAANTMQNGMPPPPPPQPAASPSQNQVPMPPPPPPPAPSPPGGVDVASNAEASLGAVQVHGIKPTDGNAIVFSNKHKDEATEPHTIIAGKKTSGSAKYALFGVLAIVFIATYTFVWMILFKVIELPI